LVKGDVEDIAAGESDESEDESSEYETASDSGEDESSVESAAKESISGSASVARAATFADHSPSSTRHAHEHRGRNDPNANNRSLRSRSKTRSMGTLKSMLSGKKSDVPPVPSIPRHLPPSPLSQPPPSPARSSMEGRSSAQRRPPPVSANAQKRRDKQIPGLQPPELHHIPNLLPVFVEIMKPLLRPTPI